MTVFDKHNARAPRAIRIDMPIDPWVDVAYN